MKKIITLISIICVQHGFSQTNSIPPIFYQLCEVNIPTPEKTTNTLQAKFQILIESLPEIAEESTELSFNLETKGIYSFKLASTVVIPNDYTLVIQDLKTGNNFDLPSNESHSFSVNRAMTKTFSIQMRKSISLTMTQKEALSVLLF